MVSALYILLIPLAIFLVLGLVRMPDRLAGRIGTAGMAVCTALAWMVAARFKGSGAEQLTPYHVEWLRLTENLHIDLGILLDRISVMMLVVITSVSLMVHIYSLGYMKGERGFRRYYALLSLFSLAMLGLVVATNIFQIYLFWELVGVSSYLLIGFYYTKPEAVAASKKAFIVTRFADLGFLIGILILSYHTGTFDFGELTGAHVAASMQGASFLGLSAAWWAMALIFMGGAGKSAMFPLHIWLPDAMEGPTPVSALIHAATMVVAGVYLVVRLFAVYLIAAPDVLAMIGYLGAFTALFAAIVAITQTDIKRVLAFSTISQIAYMFAALGVAAPDPAMFHLFTHAFFKALLFLGAGSVIHAVHSNQMGRMGGLRRYMPITHITFLIACLAIAGIPPFSGFFSKDEILAAAHHANPIIFWTLWAVAGLTAFYMFRLYYRIFWGREHKHDHPLHESGWAMRLPLIVLAAVTCVAGWARPVELHWNVAALGVAVALLGIALATWLYMRPSERPARIVARMGGFYRAALHKFYIDQAWYFVTRKIIFRHLSTPLARFDKRVIDGSMDGLGGSTARLSWAIRRLQSGRVQLYAWVFIAGVLLITIWALLL